MIRIQYGPIVAAVCALALAGCGGVRESMGAAKQGPDETAIATRAPLVVPATFDLKAPQPGAPRPQDADTATAAQRVLGGGTARTAPASDGEKALLSASGAANANPAIRQELRNETREASKRKTYADGVLFWRGDKVDTGTPLVAAEEAARVRTMRPVADTPQPEPVIEKKAVEPEPAAVAAAEEAEEKAKTEAEEDKDEGGGWFDWF